MKINQSNNFWINELSAFFFGLIYVPYFIFIFPCWKDVDIVGCRNAQYVRIKSANSTNLDLEASLPL